MARLISAFLTACVFAGSAIAAPCITAKDICTEWVNVGPGHDRVMVYRTYPLDSRNEAISRALIVVHGMRTTTSEARPLLDFWTLRWMTLSSSRPISRRMA